MKERITITDIAPSHGSKRKSWRVGRGIGSGSGKTSSRGHKGYGSRSGSKRSPGFEGGQMPFVRRFPKTGFNSLFRTEYIPLNIGKLEKFNNGAVVDVSLLKKEGLVKGNMPLKILGGGKLSKKLTIRAAAFSESAKKAIESAGGKAEIVNER